MRKLFFASACVLIACAAPADAGAPFYQSYAPEGLTYHAPAAEVPDDPHMSGKDLALTAAFGYAACLAGRHPGMIAKYIGGRFDDPATRKVLQQANDNKCFSPGRDLVRRFGVSQPQAVVFGMPEMTLRGALFRSLYRTTFRHDPDVLAAQPVDFTRFISGRDAADDTRYASLLSFADCVVRADASDSAHLIRADVGGKAEAGALAGLAPHYAPCLPQGSQMAFDKGALEGVIAEALYREAESAESGPGQLAAR